MGKIVYLKKENITLTAEEYDEYYKLFSEARITESLIRILIIRHKLKKIIKNAKRRT
jgi:hypothetical protein